MWFKPGEFELDNKIKKLKKKKKLWTEKSKLYNFSTKLTLTILYITHWSTANHRINTYKSTATMSNKCYQRSHAIANKWPHEVMCWKLPSNKKYGNYLICQATKDCLVNNHRGPDKTDGNTRVVVATCTSWLSTPALVFRKGGFEKK